ncbi:MAG: secretin N-terminal domain-containing protein, partial [Pirellulaceae bacterium]
MTLRPRTLLCKSLIIAMLFTPTISLAQLPISPSKLQVYSVQHTTAADVAKKLQATLATIEPTAEVIVDASRNRIIVNGGPRVQRLALQILQTVDRPAQTIRQVTAQEQQVVKDYIVPAAELDRITATLEKNFPAANVVKNPRLSQVIVIGSQTDQNKIAAWLANQNAARAPRPIPATLGASTTQTFPLGALTPDQMVQQLSHLLADRVVQTRGQNGALTTFVSRSVDAQVRLQVDQVNRRVILTGPQNLLPRWARLVSALDKPLQSSTRAMSLDHAAPADVRRTIGLLRQASHVERGLATAAIPLGNGGEPVFQVAAQPGQDEGGPPMPPDPATGDLGNDVEDPDSGLIGDVQIVFIPELG